MSQLYVIVLAIIVLVLLTVAIYRTTRVKTKTDYLVAGRSLPAFVLVGRLTDLTDTQVQDAWERGDRESVIMKAMAKAKK